jgi:hypothetical protein
MDKIKKKKTGNLEKQNIPSVISALFFRKPPVSENLVSYDKDYCILICDAVQISHIACIQENLITLSTRVQYSIVNNKAEYPMFKFLLSRFPRT